MDRELKKFKKILFTSDLTENSQFIFDVAVSVAVHYCASITIIHVLEDLPPGSRGLLIRLVGEEKYEELLKKRETTATELLIGKKKYAGSDIIKNALLELCQRTISNMKCSGDELLVDDIVVTHGDTAEEILSYAEKGDYDLIVMGCYSKFRGISERIIGSTANAVLHRSNKAVLLVPVPQDA